jgi:hypothetical protein
MIKLISIGKDSERVYFGIFEISYGEAMENFRSLVGFEVSNEGVAIDILFIRVSLK